MGLQEGHPAYGNKESCHIKRLLLDILEPSNTALVWFIERLGSFVHCVSVVYREVGVLCALRSRDVKPRGATG